MSARLASALAAVATLIVAGCVAPTADVTPQSVGDLDLLTAVEPLWADPQNAPHPAFGWPTLTNPGTGAGLSEWWLPITPGELPAHIVGIEPLAALGDSIPQGAGIAIFGGLAVVPGFSDESYIVDIRDPSAPVVLSTFEPTQGSHRGAAIVAYPDGRLVTALSTGPGFELWDITNPAMPVQTAEVEPTNGGHKLGIVPGTPILYNANSNGGGSLQSPDRLTGDGTGITEIYDLTDPSNPVLVQDFPNGYGCHHIFFWNNAEKQRAICSGIEFAQIWDVADPKNPVVLVNVPVPTGIKGTPSPSLFPVVTPFAHFSILNADGTVLIVGDEMGGGSIPPGCSASGVPTGALWFYDVTDEMNPSPLGWYSPGTHGDPGNAMASCTAHHGRLVPDPEGRDLLAMSFYGAGVVLLDFSDPMMPVALDQYMDGTNTWETWYYNGYLFTGDLNRGMDVFKFL